MVLLESNLFPRTMRASMSMSAQLDTEDLLLLTLKRQMAAVSGSDKNRERDEEGKHSGNLDDEISLDQSSVHPSV